MPEEGRPGIFLADQLTLFQPGDGILSPPITTGTPNVFHLSASLLGVVIPVLYKCSTCPLVFGFGSRDFSDV